MHSPLQLRLIRFYFSLITRISPSLAVYSAYKLFHYPVNTTRKNRDEIMLPPAKMFTIPLYDAVTLQGYKWGKDSHPKILLVHGWSTTSRSMSHFTNKLLNHNYQVISYDALRHGSSKGHFSDLAGWADSVQATVKHIGKVECIVAHSFGGAAVTVASKLGLNTNKLVLIAPIHDISSVADNFAKHLHIPLHISEEMRTYTWNKNKKNFQKYGTDWENILISDFHVPTLLIHDINDKEIGIEHSKQICKMWPWAKLITTKNLGHREILDDSKVADALLNFINAEATH